MGMTFAACIVGNPATKKTSNRVVTIKPPEPVAVGTYVGQPKTQKRGFTKVLPSKAYVAWEQHATLQLRAAWNREERGAPYEGPVTVCAQFYRRDRRADLINLCQALADVLQSAGILKNDRQIVSWDGCSQHLDKQRPRVAVCVVSR